MKVKEEWFISNWMVVGVGGCGSHNKYLVWSHESEGEIRFEGRDARKAGRAVENGGRAVIDPNQVANLPEGTVSHGSSMVVTSTRDVGSRFETMIWRMRS